MKRVRIGLFLLPGMFTACDCSNNLQNLVAKGQLDPAVYSFGVVRAGATCTAVLKVKNAGQQDLNVTGANFVDDGTNGAMTVKNFPTQGVQAGGAEDITIQYAPPSPTNGIQTATLQLNTNDPANGGKVSASVSGEATDAAAGKLLPLCKVKTEDTQDPGLCTLMEFGATPKLAVGAAGGLTRVVTISNDGTAPFNIIGVNVLPANGSTTLPEFAVDLVNNQAPTSPFTNVTVQPGRSGDCGQPVTGVPAVTITLRFSPTVVGIQTARIQVITDATTAGTGDGNPSPGQANITVSGTGSGVGLGIDPTFISFGTVAPGTTKEEDIRVSNLDINPASVNTTCIDLNDNGTCYQDAACTSGCALDPADLPCTGGAADPSSGLNCRVVGQGKGFLLTATDAMAGGSDEAQMKVSWTPPAAASFTKNLLLMTNVSGNRVYSVRLTGGVAGNIVVDPGSVLVPANADTVSATGSATFTVRNTGLADLVVTKVEFQGSPSITDDFTLTRAEDAAFNMSCTRMAGQQSCTVAAWTTPFTLTPNASSVFTLSFADNDAVVSLQDSSILITHNGTGGSPYVVDVAVCKPASGTSNRPTCP